MKSRVAFSESWTVF